MMNRCLKIAGFFLFVIWLNACGLLERNNDSAIQWHEEDLSEYVLYAFDPGGNLLVVLDVQTGEIIKTLHNLDGIQSAVTNSDGTRVFVSVGTGSAGANPGHVYMINTTDWSREIIYDRAAHVLSSRDGRVFFMTKQTDHETGGAIADRMFGTIDPQSGSLTEIDSISVRWGAYYDDYAIKISSKRPLLYALDSDHGLYRFNYETGERQSIFSEINFASAARIHLSANEEFIYIPSGPSLALEKEENIGSIPVWRLGHMASRRDNREVYITDPGGYLRDPLPSGKISVYSPDHNRIIGQIEILVDDPNYGPRMTDDIFLTDKERYAIVSDWMRTFFVLDLKTRSLESFATYPSEDYPDFFSLTRIYLSKKPPGL